MEKSPAAKFLPTTHHSSQKLKTKIALLLSLKINLKIISNCAIQWKMSFNIDLNKQAVEIPFSKKHKKDNYPPLILMAIMYKQLLIKSI